MHHRVLSLVKVVLVLAALRLFAIGSEAIAYSATEWSLTTKVERSDAIIVGKVLGTRKHLVGLSAGGINLQGEDHTATVMVTSVLKGSPSKEIVVDYAGPMPEDHPDCCVTGNSYVFFLEHVRANLYESINQRYGIYRIAPDRELPAAKHCVPRG
jgi:hypothetical protein